MRPSHRIFGFAVLLAFLCADPAFSQEQERYAEGTVRVILSDGQIVVGVVEREDEQEIVIRSASGVTTTIPRDRIRSISQLDGRRFYRLDPNHTRLFFAPTARPLGSGNGYLALYEIFAPFVAFGAGDYVTLAGGITINPGNARVLYAAPKVTVLNREKISVAVGGIGVALVGEADGSAGLVFSVATYGGSEAALTGGLAFGFAEGDIDKNVVLLLGGEKQVSNSIKLLSENYLFTGAGGDLLLSGGVRFFGDRLAADIGLITVTSLLDEGIGFPFLPWLGFAYNFR